MLLMIINFNRKWYFLREIKILQLPNFIARRFSSSLHLHLIQRSHQNHLTFWIPSAKMIVWRGKENWKFFTLNWIRVGKTARASYDRVKWPLRNGSYFCVNARLGTINRASIPRNHHCFTPPRMRNSQLENECRDNWIKFRDVIELGSRYCNTFHYAARKKRFRGAKFCFLSAHKQKFFN